MSGAISLDKVSVSFPLKEGGHHTVFSGLDLTIANGEFVTIVGQTGCGKSTLLKLLLGSEKPTEGRVLVDGEVVSQPDRDRGYVPQKYSLFPDKTVLHNVAFGPLIETWAPHKLLSLSRLSYRKQVHQESLGYILRVGLKERDANKYPDQLSGGMQQRVAIAQALIMKPKLLLMDEAFSALDPATRTDMQRLIRSIWGETGTTVVFVTHNLAEAIFLANRVVLLAKDDQRDHSHVALDLRIPDYIRKPDGYPRQEELQALIHQVETVALGARLEKHMAEFGG